MAPDVYTVHSACRNPHFPHGYPQKMGIKACIFMVYGGYAQLHIGCIKIIYRLWSFYAVFGSFFGIDCDLHIRAFSNCRHNSPAKGPAGPAIRGSRPPPGFRKAVGFVDLYFKNVSF